MTEHRPRDQRMFTLDPQSYDAFTEALNNPPPPGPKLRALLRRIPCWNAGPSPSATPNRM